MLIFQNQSLEYLSEVYKPLTAALRLFSMMISDSAWQKELTEELGMRIPIRVRKFEH
jgi:hypothetical protein